MPRLTRRALPAAVLALAMLAAGCPDKKDAPAPSPGVGDSEGTPERLSPPRAKVPLPPGWSARVAEDESFQAGPPDRPVLRVDKRLGEGEELPPVEELVRSIRQQFAGFQVLVDQQEGGEQFSLVRVTLVPKLADGGLGPQGPVLLGARRVGDDLFLCATLPGASTEEVRLAAAACRDLQVQTAPR